MSENVGGLFEEPAPVAPEPTAAASDANTQKPADSLDRTEAVSTIEDLAAPEQSTSTSVIPDQTTLLPNEAEAFTLQPLDITSVGKIRANDSLQNNMFDLIFSSCFLLHE